MMIHPSRSHFFVLTHIPKCGGTSIDRSFSQLLGGSPVHHREGDRRPVGQLTDAQRSQTLFLTGHFTWTSPVVGMFKQTPLFISTVRDPVSRLVSYYSYQRSKVEEQGSLDSYRQIYMRPVDEFAESAMEAFATNRSLCQFFAGTPKFEAARAVIKENYTLVASIRSLSRALCFLAGYLEAVPGSFAEVRGRDSGSRRYALSAEMASRLREAFSEDTKLVAWVEEQEEAMFASAEARLAPIAEGLRGPPLGWRRELRRSRKLAARAAAG